MALQILDLASGISDPGAISKAGQLKTWVPGLNGNAAFARDDVYVCV